jgi:hypothetical protein
MKEVDPKLPKRPVSGIGTIFGDKFIQKEGARKVKIGQNDFQGPTLGVILLVHHEQLP